MSFISKRERVFSDYDLLDLPARNEGKLKAYSSCTDARAWSHFCSDKSDHLVEIIKRNNETCRPKYIPTDVIVNTLMGSKNAEINRLRRKIEEYDQLLAAFDQLELTSEQKAEIANAHAAIKAANKQLDDMCLDLDLSGFTEGIDSEAFETGKSRGDEIMRPQDFEMETSRATEWSADKSLNQINETKSNQTGGLSCPCDASTVTHDPRIDEMQETIITKDAKLNAMRNTIAVMENDVCEPYCIYAHIFTALVKIFGVLCQNEKYKHYLDLLTSGKDTRNVDIKGKIFYKLKVLEKFSCALISPCTKNCSCYNTEIISRVETAFALTTQDNFKISVDKKRAHLVADIIGNDEMKQLLDRKKTLVVEETSVEENLVIENNFNIDVPNINRLKNLQASYDDLLKCYEELKFEKNCLTVKCQKYDELQKEFEKLQNTLNSYNSLRNEKEYYKKRSEDLDDLKGKYIVLADETLNMETQLRAQIEINEVKSTTVDQMRNENTALQKKLNHALTACEKEKHALICKLNESECKIMCQDQQIETLTIEINKFLGKKSENESKESEIEVIELIDQINYLKEEVKILKDALFYKDEEKHQFQTEYQEKLKIIDDLRVEIENWKDINDKAIRCNDYLEKLTKDLQNNVENLTDENKKLASDVETQTNAIEKLIDVVNNKCSEIKELADELNNTKQENNELLKELHELNHEYDSKIHIFEIERQEALNSLKLASQKSEIFLSENEKFDPLSTEQKNSANEEIINKFEKYVKTLVDEPKTSTSGNHHSESSILINEIDKFVAHNTESIKNLLNQSNESAKCLEEKRNEILESKLRQIDSLNESLDRLKEEKNNLESELQEKTNNLNRANSHIQILTEEKQHFIALIEENKKVKEDLVVLKHQTDNIFEENNNLKNDLLLKSHKIQNLLNNVAKLKKENQGLILIYERIKNLEKNFIYLCEEYNNLSSEKDNILTQLREQRDELRYLHNTVRTKTNENEKLIIELKSLQEHQLIKQNEIDTLQNDNVYMASKLTTIETENNLLKKEIETQNFLQKDFRELKASYDELKTEKDNLENVLNLKSTRLKDIETKNKELQETTTNLIKYNNEIESTLISTRNQLQDTLPSNLYVGLKQEVELIKQENNSNIKQINCLLKKLDESDQVIATLGKDISDRDVKISILENHVNELGDEVRRLQGNLATMIEVGEEISTNDIDQSLKRMEAHHSKATHNMKIEMAKLMDQNLKLEEQLSATKLENEGSIDQNDSLLDGEREIIATDIKQLEIRCVGDSALSPDNCCINSILMSLERIGNYIDTRNNSCQLVLHKADEAKKIVEKEKQKIMKEKEEAIKDKKNVQKQLSVLKEILEQRISEHKNVINDLEGELLNQKLIIEKMKQSIQDYILKLEEEIRSMGDLYKKALAKIRDFDVQLENANKEREQNHSIIENVKMQLEEKCQDIKFLQITLNHLKNKNISDSTVQTNLKYFSNTSAQTENRELHENSENNIIPITGVVSCEKSKFPCINPNKLTILNSEIKQNDLLLNIHPREVNNVQILTANTNPCLDFVKNAYLQYKIQKLSLGGMEKYSVSCISEEDAFDSEDKESIKVSEKCPIICSDANISKHDEINHEDSFTKSEIENYKSKTDTAPVTFVQKTNNGTVFTDSSKSGEGSLISTDINIANNKDFIIIYQDSDNESQSIIQTELINKKERLIEPKNRKRSRESVEPQNNGNDEHKQKNVRPPFERGNKNDTLISNHLYSHISSSDTSLLRDHATVTKAEQKNVININKRSDSYISRSFNSFKSFVVGTESQEITDDANGEMFYTVSNKKVDMYFREQESIYHKDIFYDRKNKSYDCTHDIVSLNKTRGEIGTKTNIGETKKKVPNFDKQYLLSGKKCKVDSRNTEKLKNFELRRSRSTEIFNDSNVVSKNSSLLNHPSFYISLTNKSKLTFRNHTYFSDQFEMKDVAVMAQMDNYNDKIKFLTTTLENIDRNYKEKIRAIKAQYDNNIKNIMKEHNQGVQSLQNLHEETLQDILKVHENETDNLRTMSIEAMRKVDKLEKENKILRAKIFFSNSPNLNEEVTNTSSTEIKRHSSKYNSRFELKTLTKTNVEEFNINPKAKIYGPCTCSLDINISDAIRNIFEQVDVDQRRIAEQAYLKNIANKILIGSIETLDIQELSFLHFKICRTWKSILRKEEVLHKRIDSMETELINKQKQTNKHLADIDRKVAEERRRLQEVREAVCRDPPVVGRISVNSPHPRYELDTNMGESNITCTMIADCDMGLEERLPAGDLATGLSCTELRYHRANRENHRTVPAKMNAEERREKKIYCDERPTRLRRSSERSAMRSHKK